MEPIWVSFVEQLKRRGVFRVALAYLAIAWLVLQVIDVLSGILVWANWVAQSSLIVLAVGFPVALLLAWSYDVTPEGIVGDSGAADVPVPTRLGGRKIDFVIIGALVLVIALLIAKDSIIVDVDPSVPTVSAYERVTESQVIMPPFPSPYPLVAGNSRLYFSTFETGRMTVKQVAMTGGSAEPVDMPEAGIDTLFRPVSTLPDGSGLVVLEFDPWADTVQLWSIPFVGGSPRLLGPGADGVYSPDGARIAYVMPSASLHVADADMSKPRTVVEELPGRVHWIRWSPDGKHLRYSLEGPARSIWEVNLNDGQAQPERLFPDWANINHCCGNWTPDGEYYVFQATPGARTQLYALRESDRASDPVQITDGALDYRRPTIAPDGKSLFAIGWQLRGETVAMDPETGQLRSIAVTEDLAGEWVSYATNADRMVWISYPDGDLWVSRSDGSDRQQLTFDEQTIYEPTLSADGEVVSWVTRSQDEGRSAFVMPSIGGVAERIGPEDESAVAGNWSPVGRQLLVRTFDRDAIQIYDYDTGSFAELPGTEGLWVMRWSPSGRQLLAKDTRRVVLYDIETGETRALLEDRPHEYVFWIGDDSHIYIVDPHTYGADRGIYKVDTTTGNERLVTRLGNKRLVFGDLGMWVGISPDGEPMFVRDLSIHHIYRLSWLP